MESYEFIQQTLNELARSTKKGSVTSARVANIIRSVLERAEGRLQELTSEMAKKADIVNGKIPSSQIPDGFDDIQEYASREAFPIQGVEGIIYVALDTNITWRWSGSTYSIMNANLALGETSSTAYPGNKGKQNAAEIASLRELIGSLQNLLAGKANSVHSHEMSDIEGLGDAFAAKANTNHTHRVADMSDYENLRSYIIENGIGYIAKDSGGDDEMVFRIWRPDNTAGETFVIVAASPESPGIMTPAMVEKLLEVDNKANSDHTHTTSQVEGLDDSLSALNTKTSSNQSASEKNSQDIETLRAMLQGKNVAKVFPDMASAVLWLSNVDNRRVLLPGSNIWIEDENEDDYWVSEVLDEPDPETSFYYKIRSLKTETPSLDGYAEKGEENTFTESNTFENDVTIRGLLELFGQVLLYNSITVYNAGETDGPSAHISGGTVSVGQGNRYGTLSGRITRNGVGGYSIYRNPLSHSTVEKDSCLNYEELTLSETGKEDITITKEDFKALLAIKQQLQNVKAPLNVTALLTNYSQDITFEDLQNAQKLFCTIEGVYHEVRIAALREGDPVSDGALYYEDLTEDGLVKYLYSIVKTSDGPIETSEPEIIGQGGSDVDFVETSEDVYREDV